MIRCMQSVREHYTVLDIILDVYKRQGTIKEAGTHTIDLKQKGRLVKGEKFSIVIKIGSTARIGCDHSDNFGWIRFVNKTAKGQSYVCLKGNKWYDLYSARLTMRIKAYTTT